MDNPTNHTMRQFLKQSLCLICLSALCGGLSAWLHPLAPPATKPTDPWAVTLTQVADWDQPPLWVDARSETDFAKAHIPGAIPLNLSNWEAQLGPLLMTWMPDKRVVVYCSTQACGESKDVAQRLREAYQLEQTYYLEGGWEAWQEVNR